MWVRLKGWLIAYISSYRYLIIFVTVFLFDADSRYNKAMFMATLSILSLAWAIMLYRRVRLIEDTLTTGLDSAAQGYAELEGKVSLYEGETARGLHIDLPPMVWYRSKFVESGSGFVLDDGYGRCTIDPRDAEVISPLYSYNSRRYHAIYPGETIYALGNLETLKKHIGEHERDGLIRSKVIEWKKNQYKLLDYFDSDRSGTIDNAEMNRMKEAAARDVDAEMEERYRQAATHVVSTPEDGRPFILSSIHPDNLLRRYKRAIAVHVFAWIYLSVLVLAMQVN